MTSMYMVMMLLLFVLVADAQNIRQARDVATETDVSTLRGMFVQTRGEVEELQTSMGAKLDTMDGKIDSLVAAVNALKTSSENPPAISYKKAFPIFLVKSSAGNYMFTLSQARAKCIENGATLATLAQLKVANAQGMDKCSCGWIDEGYAAYPILYPRKGCFEEYGPTIRASCTWKSTWNSWCFDKTKVWTYLVEES